MSSLISSTPDPDGQETPRLMEGFTCQSSPQRATSECRYSLLEQHSVWLIFLVRRGNESGLESFCEEWPGHMTLSLLAKVHF